MIKFSPRYFILPIIALVVIGSLPAPAGSGNSDTRGSGCGPALSNISDPGLRATFERFDRSQSAAAAKICAIYRNSVSPSR
jgi:hypothetical protein